MAGNNAAQKDEAGFFCFNGGPQNWTHCLRAEKFGYPSVPVKVFSEDSEDFLGTELRQIGEQVVNIRGSMQ